MNQRTFPALVPPVVRSAPFLSKAAGLVSAVLLLVAFNTPGASVGPGGYTNAFQGAAPIAADWPNLAVAGDSSTILDAAVLNAVVQSLPASSITAALGNGGAGTPGATGGNAVWRSDGFLQTRASANACTLLMATFVNATGTNASSIKIRDDFTAALPLNEVVFGHLVY